MEFNTTTILQLINRKDVKGEKKTKQQKQEDEAKGEGDRVDKS